MGLIYTELVGEKGDQYTIKIILWNSGGTKVQITLTSLTGHIIEMAHYKQGVASLTLLLFLIKDIWYSFRETVSRYKENSLLGRT